MHSNVTIKNVSWLHFSWPTLYYTIRYDTIVTWCTLKYKIKNRPVAYYRVSKSYVVHVLKTCFKLGLKREHCWTG